MTTELPADELGFIEGPIEGMYFVSIQAGSFVMGSPRTEAGRYDFEGPQHTVTLGRFEIMTTEVTQGMWEEVMGTTVTYLRSLSEFAMPYENVGSDVPIYYVNYFDCMEFIEALNARDPSYVYRLPSESEWEYAYRAGTATPFYWGASSTHSNLSQYCWCKSTTGNKNAQPVASLLPNAWGLYDMSGNMWEWCEDWWNDSYANWSGAPADGSAWNQGNFPHLRILRGGATVSEAVICRSAQRHALDSSERHNTIGFRVVRESADISNANRLLQEGSAFLSAEDYTQAIACFEGAIQLVPEHVEANQSLGYALLIAGRFSEAVLSLSRAIELNPTLNSTYFLRGAANMYCGSFDEATIDYEYCLAADSSIRSSVLYNLACMYGLKGDPAMSILYLEQTVDAGFTNLEHMEADSDLETVRNAPEFEEGMERIREIIGEQ